MKSDHPWGRAGNADLLNKLALEVGYVSGEIGNLMVAVTHKSFANEALAPLDHNERLEFLGDAVLDLVVAEALMKAHPTVPEGDLSRHRATLVSARSLAEVANILDLGAVLRLGRGEQRSGGRQKESLLADAFEAVVGAIYLDHGLDAVQHFVLAHLGERIDATDVRIDDQDFKTKLQEYSQRAFQKAPTYEVIGESGPDHAKEFHVAVLLNGESFAEGMGHSKKTAERAAAGRALRLIEEGQVLA